MSIVDVYVQLKTLIRKYVEGKSGTMEQELEMDERESKRLLRLGNLVLVDYVRAMVELLAQHLTEVTDKLEKSEQKMKSMRQKKSIMDLGSDLDVVALVPNPHEHVNMNNNHAANRRSKEA